MVLPIIAAALAISAGVYEMWHIRRTHLVPGDFVALAATLLGLTLATVWLFT